MATAISNPLLIVLVLNLGNISASELIAQARAPHCSAVAQKIESNNLTLSRGLSINCNPNSELAFGAAMVLGCVGVISLLLKMVVERLLEQDKKARSLETESE